MGITTPSLERAHQPNGGRKLEELLAWAKPIRLLWKISVIWTVTRSRIYMRQNTAIDFEAELEQRCSGINAETVSACPINCRRDVKTLFQSLPETREFFSFHKGREVARIGIPLVHFLTKRRVDPWMQMRRYIAASIAKEF